MAICFSSLDLMFLDMELEELDNETTLGPRDVASPSGDVDPHPPTA